MKPRPFIKRHADGFWLIHIGRTDYVIGNYYTSQQNAINAAHTIRRSHR